METWQRAHGRVIMFPHANRHRCLMLFWIYGHTLPLCEDASYSSLGSAQCLRIYHSGHSRALFEQDCWCIQFNLLQMQVARGTLLKHRHDHTTYRPWSMPYILWVDRWHARSQQNRYGLVGQCKCMDLTALTLYMLNISEETKTYIHILCHSSPMTWHR